MRFRAATSSCSLSSQPLINSGVLLGHAYSTAPQGGSGSVTSVHGAGRARRDMAPCRLGLDRLHQGCWVRSRWLLYPRSPCGILKWTRWTQVLASVSTGLESKSWSCLHSKVIIYPYRLDIGGEIIERGHVARAPGIKCSSPTGPLEVHCSSRSIVPRLSACAWLVSGHYSRNRPWPHYNCTV